MDTASRTAVSVSDNQASASTTPANPFGLINNELVQVREDDNYLYIDIGSDDHMCETYRKLYHEAEALEDRYMTYLRSLLAELQGEM